MSEDVPQAVPHPGGLVLGPGGEDSVLIMFDAGAEQVFTAEQVRRMTSEGTGGAHPA